MNIQENIFRLLQSNNVFGLDSVYLTNFIIYKLNKKPTLPFEQTLKDNTIVKDIIIQLTNKYTIIPTFIDDTFKYYFENDTQINIKEYSKFYNNLQLINKLVLMANITNNVNSILDCNVKVNSFLESVITNHNISTDKLYGVQTNQYINNINIMSLLNKTTVDFSNMFTTNDILTKDFPFTTKSFDVIFCDFPSGIHNIIHANCCNKIKKLKIRGTKFEPLLLQLLMLSLNKNSKALLIVPDSLLFSDSIQFIETRKYLLENFHVKKIIEINNTKTSVLFFENTTVKTDISISRFDSNYNEEHIMNMTMLDIKNNNYSLWYKHYTTKINNNIIEYSKVEDLFDIKLEYFYTKKSNGLCLKKYYNDTNSIKIFNDSTTDISNYDYFIINKNDMQIFNTYYLHNMINKSYEKYTKGKMKQFNIDSIKNIMIPNISNDKQTAICNYINISNNIICENNNMITHYELLKNNLLELVISDTNVRIDTICTLKDTSDNRMIGVIRNGLTAGTVYMVEKGSILSSNSYYLQVHNNNYNLDYVYHMLKFNEAKIKTIACLPSQPNLNKSSLLSFEIISIDIAQQHEIVCMCNDFDNHINKYMLSTQNIKDKDIFNVVLKIYNL